MHYSCVRQTGTDLGDTAIDGTIWLGPDGTNHSAASSHGLGLGFGLGPLRLTLTADRSVSSSSASGVSLSFWDGSTFSNNSLIGPTSY